MIAAIHPEVIAGAIGYGIWAAAILGIAIYATRRAYLRGHDAGWDACTEELCIDADQADDAVQQHEQMVKDYVLPILARRPATKYLPLQSLDTEHLLRLLETSDPAHAKQPAPTAQL